MQPMPTTISDRPEIEYLDGRAHPKVSPRLEHGALQARLARMLADCAQNRGLVVTEVRFNIGAASGRKTEFLPDVAFISKERLSSLSGEALQEPPFSPDVAIEIRSPSDNLPYLRNKIQRYLATGSVLVLDVDPKTRIIHAHTQNSIHTFEATDTFAQRAVPWLRFEVKNVFSVLSP